MKKQTEILLLLLMITIIAAVALSGILIKAKNKRLEAKALEPSYFMCKHKLYDRTVEFDLKDETTTRVLCLLCVSYIDFEDKLTGERMRIMGTEQHQWDCKEKNANKNNNR